MGPLESFFWTNPKIQIGQISLHRFYTRSQPNPTHIWAEIGKQYIERDWCGSATVRRYWWFVICGSYWTRSNVGGWNVKEWRTKIGEVEIRDELEHIRFVACEQRTLEIRGWNSKRHWKKLGRLTFMSHEVSISKATDLWGRSGNCNFWEIERETTMNDWEGEERLGLRVWDHEKDSKRLRGSEELRVRDWETKRDRDSDLGGRPWAWGRRWRSGLDYRVVFCNAPREN